MSSSSNGRAAPTSPQRPMAGARGQRVPAAKLGSVRAGPRPAARRGSARGVRTASRGTHGRLGPGPCRTSSMPSNPAQMFGQVHPRLCFDTDSSNRDCEDARLALPGQPPPTAASGPWRRQERRMSVGAYAYHSNTPGQRSLGWSARQRTNAAGDDAPGRRLDGQRPGPLDDTKKKQRIQRAIQPAGAARNKAPERPLDSLRPRECPPRTVAARRGYNTSPGCAARLQYFTGLRGAARLQYLTGLRGAATILHRAARHGAAIKL